MHEQRVILLTLLYAPVEVLFSYFWLLKPYMVKGLSAAFLKRSGWFILEKMIQTDKKIVGIFCQGNENQYSEKQFTDESCVGFQIPIGTNLR